MKFNLINNNRFILYINTSYLIVDKENLYDNVKKLLIKVRKRYAYDIYGYYDVDIYNIGNFRTILLFNKKDNDDFFRNTIDLKINYHEKIISPYFDDYYLVKDYPIEINGSQFYIDKSELKKRDIVKLCEFYSVEKLNLQ